MEYCDNCTLSSCVDCPFCCLDGSETAKQSVYYLNSTLTVDAFK